MKSICLEWENLWHVYLTGRQSPTSRQYIGRNTVKESDLEQFLETNKRCLVRYELTEELNPTSPRVGGE